MKTNKYTLEGRRLRVGGSLRAINALWRGTHLMSVMLTLLMMLVGSSTAWAATAVLQGDNTKNADYAVKDDSQTILTLNGECCPGGTSGSLNIGGQNYTGSKLRSTNVTLGDETSKGLLLTVTEGYVITKVDLGFLNARANTAHTLTGVYADGDYSTNLLTSSLTTAHNTTAVYGTVNVAAASKLEFTFTSSYDNDGQTQLNQIGFAAVFTYEALPADEHTVTFGLGDSGALGTLPESQTGKFIILPAVNRLLAKPGYTLTGWNDGSKTYAMGAVYIVNSDVTMTPVFTENTKNLNKLDEDASVTWAFHTSIDASVPTIAWKNESEDHYYVMQAKLDGVTQDVILKKPIGSKLATNNSNGWGQLNANCELHIPASTGMFISLDGSYSGSSATVTADDLSETDMTSNSGRLEYTYMGTASEIKIKITGGTWYKALYVTYPAGSAPAAVVPSSVGTYTGYQATLTASGYDVIPTPTVQWYKCDDAEKTNTTAISGATATTYSFLPSTAGTYYYYCVATNTKGTSTSNVCTVTVTDREASSHTFNFSPWSSTTISALTAAVNDNALWSTKEKADASSSDNDGKGYYNEGDHSEGLLMANGSNIMETSPLKVYAPSHGLGIINDLGSTDIGTYNSSNYLWLTGTSTYLVIPGVKTGSSIKVGIESHKTSVDRGLKAYYKDASGAWKQIGDSYLAGTYAEKTIDIPSVSGLERTDVKLQAAVGGMHLYYIDAVIEGFNLVRSEKQLNVGDEFSITEGTDYSRVSVAPLTFSTTNTDIITLTADGKVTAKTSGTATVTISQAANGIYAATERTFTVYVTQPSDLVKVSDLYTVMGTAIDITKGTHYTTSSTGVVTYSSANTSVVAVTSDGKLTALAAGTAEVTANQAGAGVYPEGKITFKVTVVNPNEKTWQDIPGQVDLSKGDLVEFVYESDNQNLGYMYPYKDNCSATFYLNNITESSGELSFYCPWFQNPDPVWFTIYDVETGLCEVHHYYDGVSGANTSHKFTLPMLRKGKKIFVFTNENNGKYNFGWNINKVVFNLAPYFTMQPNSETYVKSGVPVTLTATATDATGGDVTYQWYKNTTASNTGGTAINGDVEGMAYLHAANFDSENSDNNLYKFTNAGGFTLGMENRDKEKTSNNTNDCINFALEKTGTINIPDGYKVKKIEVGANSISTAGNYCYINKVTKDGTVFYGPKTGTKVTDNETIKTYEYPIAHDAKAPLVATFDFSDSPATETVAIQFWGNNQLEAWFKIYYTSPGGAVSSNYRVTLDEEGDYYYYCVATNDMGSTPSDVATVHSISNKKFDFKNWNEEDAKVHSLKSEVVGKVNGQSVYGVFAPYDMAGYIAVQDDNVYVRENKSDGFRNFGSGDRSVAILDLKSGDNVTFTGTGLDKITWKNADNTDGSATYTVTSSSATEVHITMTGNGNLGFVLPRYSDGSAVQIHTLMVPYRETPAIANDLVDSATPEVGKSYTLNIDTEGENVAYQWYRNTTNSNKGGELIAGATESSYTISEVEQTFYYYCLTTNTVTGTITSSRVQAVIVNPVVTFQCDELNNTAGPVYGQLPERIDLHSGGTFKIPVNKTLYKPDYTLQYWTPDNGVTRYYPDQEVQATKYMALKPVFRANDVSIYNSGAETTVKWQFGDKTTGITYKGDVPSAAVSEVTIDGVAIDLGIKMASGNSNKGRNDQWIGASSMTLPIVKGATVTVTNFDTGRGDFKFDGVVFPNSGGEVSSDFSGSTGNVKFVYVYTGNERELNVTLAGYVSDITIVYPPTSSMAVVANPASLVISDAKVRKSEVVLTVTGHDLNSGINDIRVSNAPAGLTYTPSKIQIGSDGLLNLQMLLTYDQQEVETEGVVTFTFTDGNESRSVGIPYGRTVVYTGSTITPVSNKTTWDWSMATADIKPVKEAYTAFQDVSGTYPSGFKYEHLEGSGEYFVRGTSGTLCFQGSQLFFNNTVPGTVEIVFSNTGTSARPYRHLNINGVNTEYRSQNTTKITTEPIHVDAGGVMIQGRFNGDPDVETDSINFAPQYLRIYKVMFTPDAETPDIEVDKETSTFTLSTLDSNDKIYYTIDGTDPDEYTGILYEPNIVEETDKGTHLNGNCTIRAITINSGKNNSEIAEKTTKFTVYKLNVYPVPSAGGVVELSPVVKDSKYTLGSKVTLRSIAKPGYAFEKWSTDRAGDENEKETPTLEVTITEDANTYYAHFTKGARGTVNYQVGKAVFIDENNKVVVPDASENDAYLSRLYGLGVFPSSSTSTSILVPSSYELYYENGPLLYWIDDTNTKYTLDADVSGDTDIYELGVNKLFDNNVENPTVNLRPVFRHREGVNSVTDLLDKRQKETKITWDFRTAYGSHPLTVGNSQGDRYYSTHANIVTESCSGGVVADIPIRFNTQHGGSFSNTDIDTWCYMTEGTEIIIPSGYDAVVTLATYAPINNSTSGTTINGVLPDNVDVEVIDRGDDRSYLYHWTVKSTDLTATLRIGDDYSYYQSLTVSLPTATRKTLYTSVNNSGMGSVSVSAASSPQRLDDGGRSYINGTTVTVTADRQKYYELKYWSVKDNNNPDVELYRIYPKDDTYAYGHYEQDDSEGNTTKTAIPNDGVKLNDVKYSAVTNGEEIVFGLDNYLNIEAIFGEKTSYYIDFSSGGQAEGLPPYQQHVEWDEEYVMPKKNQHLYLEGFTLDYYTDADGNRHDFGEHKTTTKNLLLTPHWRQNGHSLTDITEATAINWPTAVSGGATEIVFSRSAGLIVDQITIGDESIDLPLYIDCQSSGGADNTKYDSYCVVSNGSVFTVPTTKNCDIEIHSSSSNFVSTIIAGATSSNSSANADKYTAGRTATVTYKGEEAEQTIAFRENSQNLTYVKVTYKPLEDAPVLTSVSIDGVAISEAQLTTLKTTGTLTGIAKTPNYAKNTVATVTATVNNANDVVLITQPTAANPVATLLVNTKGGVTVGTYTVQFAISGAAQPTLKSVNVGSTEYTGSRVAGMGVNGVITLYFDHEMKDVTIGNDVNGLGLDAGAEPVSGVASTTIGDDENVYALRLTYWGASEGNHTLTIPAGTLTDAFGTAYNTAINVDFTVKANTVTTNRLFNFVVTHKQTWDAESQTAGPRLQTVSDDVIAQLHSLGVQYGTFDEASAAANAAGGSDRYYIFVPDGEYCLKGTEARSSTEDKPFNDTKRGNNQGLVVSNYYNGETWLKRANTSIIGQSREKTILYNDPFLYGISNTSTIEVRRGANNCYFQDFTADNRYSKYQVDRGESNPGGQAVAVYDRAIRSIWKNVSMRGYQDTYASGSSSSGIKATPGCYHTYRYYEDCDVWGTVDFLCGSGDDWWERPTFVLRYRSIGNNIVAPSHFHTSITKNCIGSDSLFTEKWGYVYHNGVIKTESSQAQKSQNGKFTLGRPWQNSPAVTFINTTFQATPSTEGWQNMSGTLVIRMHEYGSMNADGTVADLTGRTIRKSTPAAGSDDCVLTAEQAAQYTIHNVLGGDEAYDPTIYTKQVDMDDVQPVNNTPNVNEKEIRWTEKPGALCYFIFRIDEETGDTLFYSMSTSGSFRPADDQAGRRFIIRAANERGGLGKPSKAVTFKPTDSYQVTVTQVGATEGYGWATICLPENAIFAFDNDDLNVYGAISVEGHTLTLKKVTSANLGISKNVGYIIYAKVGTYTFSGTYASVEKLYDRPTAGGGSEPVYSLLGGNPEDHAVSAGSLNIYTLAYKPDMNKEVGFYKFTGSTIPAHKAYLSVEEVGSVLGIDIADAKGLAFRFIDDDEEADDIQGVKDNADATDDIIYDLSGKRVEPAQMRRGQVYIVNGRKIVKL